MVGIAVTHGHRSEPVKWRAVAWIGALSLAVLVAAPPVAQAQGIFDFLFGGFHERQPPRDANSYAEPPSPGIGRVAPPAMGSENVRQGEASTGHGVAFCVRLCDGQHFPLERMSNATPVETCRAMCPASKTKVFFGSEIGGAVAQDGQRYAALDTAFIYRKQLVGNCTCNGRDALGLARYDASRDPTLQAGDIVSTKDGFVAFSGKRGETDAFTPLTTSAVTAQLMPASAQARSARRPGPAPAAAAEVDEDPGTVTPSQTPRPVVDLQGQSAR